MQSLPWVSAAIAVLLVLTVCFQEAANRAPCTIEQTVDDVTSPPAEPTYAANCTAKQGRQRAAMWLAASAMGVYGCALLLPALRKA